MKKLGFLLVGLLSVIMGVAAGPSKGYAVLTVLTDTGMRLATAQAGIALSAAEEVSLVVEAGEFTYGDSDGTNKTPGFLSVNDVSFSGTITLNEPVSIAVGSENSFGCLSIQDNHTQISGNVRIAPQ